MLRHSLFPLKGNHSSESQHILCTPKGPWLNPWHSQMVENLWQVILGNTKFQWPKQTRKQLCVIKVLLLAITSTFHAQWPTISRPGAVAITGPLSGGMGWAQKTRESKTGAVIVARRLTPSRKGPSPAFLSYPLKTCLCIHHKTM